MGPGAPRGLLSGRTRESAAPLGSLGLIRSYWRKRSPTVRGGLDRFDALPPEKTLARERDPRAVGVGEGGRVVARSEGCRVTRRPVFSRED